MSLSYQVEAKSKDEAVIKAMRQYDIDEENIIEIIEVSKPSSFFGFFKKDGEYKITLKSEETDKNEDFSETIEMEEKEERVEDIKTTNIEIKEDTKNIEDLVVNKTKELLKHMGLVLDVEVLESKEHYVLINLSGEDNGIIIGKKGKTLNSFEYLLNSLCKSVRVEVDVEGFKEKRADTLRDLARKMAEKTLNTGKTVKLNPMPPKERKIIHEIVNKYEGLDTSSEGKDPKRYIVIRKKRMG
jgi:spoIIIJ-associated protein